MASIVRRFIISVATLGWLGSLLLSATPSHSQTSASLFLTPTKTTVAVGETFSISVNVSAPVAVNALSARVLIPTDLLEITSVSKDGSIIDFWVSGPTIDKGSGQVAMEGVALNPGYQGGRGRLANINVRAKAAGVANISFSSGSVLANDGAATNVLGSLGKTAVTIGRPSPVPGEPVEPVVKPTQPTPAIISSSTHPDQSKWYQATSAAFNWTSLLTISGSNYLLDKNEASILSAAARYRTTTATFKDIAEGVNYFHVRTLTELGWAPTAHFKIQTDNSTPEVLIVTQAATDTGSGKASLIIKATDRISGIDHFDIVIDGSDPISWQTPDGAGTFVTPPLSAGPHDLKISAVDRAGNTRTELVTIMVSPKLQVTLSLIAQELCDRYCFNRTQQIIGWFLLILLLILFFLWQRRRWVQKEFRRLEHQFVKLEHSAGREIKALEKAIGREAHLFAHEAQAEVRAVEKKARRTWLGLGSGVAMNGADRQLHKRYQVLYQAVEKEILLLEEKKAKHGLTAHESHRLKELMEVLHDVRELRHHQE